jgi:hypothetical protein
MLYNISILHLFKRLTRTFECSFLVDLCDGRKVLYSNMEDLLFIF